MQKSDIQHGHACRGFHQVPHLPRKVSRANKHTTKTGPKRAKRCHECGECHEKKIEMALRLRRETDSQSFTKKAHKVGLQNEKQKKGMISIPTHCFWLSFAKYSFTGLIGTKFLLKSI
jgi:hypothetical protein